jgi:membrane protease YdiL (CAAX protease family)
LAESVAQADYSLLPKDRSFSRSLPAFLLPYAAYVGLGSLSPGPLSPETAGLLRLLIVPALIGFFRGSYRFGPSLTRRQLLIGFAASVAATLLWVLSYRFSLSMPWWRPHPAAAEAFRPSTTYWILRTVNSVLWVPIFEELLCRGYLCELLYGNAPAAPASGASRSGAPPSGASAGSGPDLGRRLDERPSALTAPPLSAFSIIGSTALFTLGHGMSAWLPAALWFGFTTWVYARTRSFRVCILMHALTNLAIALAVARYPGLRFLWF